MSTSAVSKAEFFEVILTEMVRAGLTPPLDWNSIASQSGYKSGSVAKKRFSQIMKGAGVGGKTESAGKSTANKAKAPKKTVGSGTNVLASKVVKNKPKASKASKVSVEDENEENLEEPE